VNPPRLALLHLRTERPHAPAFQESLDRLNGAAVRVATDRGWQVAAVASAEVPLEASLVVVEQADAVVLMGGEDVHPDFYGGSLDYPGSGHHEPEADHAHIAAVRECLEARTPLLGLCRGLQVINVALAGTLVPHLPTYLLHRADGQDPFVSHRITLLDGHLTDAVDQGREVRCTHHQAVERLGRGLVVAARADDGVVEALVHAEAPITAVQWHPEHPDLADDQLAPLFDRLKEQHARRAGSAQPR
jgi:putative glutamine amidotransferase